MNPPEKLSAEKMGTSVLIMGVLIANSIAKILVVIVAWNSDRCFPQRFRNMQLLPKIILRYKSSVI